MHPTMSSVDEQLNETAQEFSCCFYFSPQSYNSQAELNNRKCSIHIFKTAKAFFIHFEREKRNQDLREREFLQYRMNFLL